MNLKTRFNPSFAPPRQRRMQLSGNRLGYWGGVKDDHWPEDLRMWLEPFSIGRCMIPDAAMMAIPMAMGMDPNRRRGPLWCISKLARMTEGELYPSQRNSVLHHYAREYIAELIEIARQRGMDPHQLPMSLEEAYDMDIEDELIAWPWLRDQRFLDEVEKSTRKMIWQAHPLLDQGREIEIDFLDANTDCFLETGWHCVEDSSYQVEHRPDLQEAAASASMPFFDFCWSDLRDSLILPRWTEWEHKDDAYFVGCSRYGFFVDRPGWREDETEQLLRRMQGYAGGYEPHIGSADEKVKAAMDRLLGFARIAEERETQELVHA